MKIQKHNLLQFFSVLVLIAATTLSPVSAQKVKYENPVKVDSLNSSAEESLPLFDLNSKTIYLVRTFHEDNIGGKKSGNQIWAFDKTEKNEFKTSTNVFDKLNNEFSNAVVGISEDGKTIYLLNQYTFEGDMKPGVSTSVLEEHKWSRPKAVNVEGISDSTEIYNVYVNQAEDIMLLSMRNTTPDSTFNVYYSQNIGGSWSTPSMLNGINSNSSNEISPYVTKDKKYLYFSSDREGGMGDFDIYRAEMNGNLSSITKVENLKSINSSSFDAYLSVGEDNSAYFSSNRGGGLADIYQTTIIEEKVDTAVAQVVDYKEKAEDVISAHPFVNFAFDVHTLNKSAKSYLDHIADSLQQNPKWDVQLDGHTDYIGSNSYNRTLSKKRAYSARDYLISKGINPKRIDTRYFGEQRPKRSNETDYGRYMNRRVEITFIR